MFPTQNKIELFARTVVDGWDCHGDEVEADITLSENS
jgi:N6-adenosine-specific RNA methylase IME4